MTIGVAGALPSQDNAPDMDCFIWSTLKKPTLFGNSLGSTLGFLHFQWTVVQRDPALGCSVSSTVGSHWFYISWGSALCSGYFFGGYMDEALCQSQWMLCSSEIQGEHQGQTPKICCFFFFLKKTLLKNPQPQINLFPQVKSSVQLFGTERITVC